MESALRTVLLLPVVALSVAVAVGGEIVESELLKERLSTDHWSFQNLHRPALPNVTDPAWSQTPVDRFVLAEIERSGQSPAGMADRRTLLRRATFNLLGLPPTLAELEAFLAEDSPDAFVKVIDRLLASPHYGERWGRHWLDIARYADSSGKDENHACANAFRFRDYVVASFNNDKPYDLFLREQLAGDLMPAVSNSHRYELITATGFLQLGPKALAEQDKEKLLMDIVDEQLDVVSRGMLGVTLTCARCHDHKLEPLTMVDYYAMAGILKSTKTMGDLEFVSNWLEKYLGEPDAIQRLEDHDKKIKENAEAIKQQKKSDQPGRDEVLKELEKEKEALLATTPLPLPAAMAVEDGEVADLKIHIRGSHLSLGESVSRGFVDLFNVPGDLISSGSSGRLELADWITHADHPLTSRVMVNRTWQWQLGAGLCSTTDNLGVSGSRPVHQDLLDWLSMEFIARAWSVKGLNRTIMLSSTYQMEELESRQADNGKFSIPHFRKRRLDAEEIRDALLAVSSQLDMTIGGSVFNYPNREPHVSYYKGPVNYGFPIRTIYLPVVRNAMYGVLDIFNHGNALTTHSARPQTTVAPQALFMLNSELVMEAAEAIGNEAVVFEMNDEERVGSIYKSILLRLPTRIELDSSLSFVETFSSIIAADGVDKKDIRRKTWQAFCQALLASNEFVYLD